MTPIHYSSDQPGDYAKALDAADSLDGLLHILAEWRELAADAEAVALKMTEKDFKDFLRGIKKERAGKFAGEAWAERFGDILMPALMFKISLMAAEFKVPFGLMYIRLKEVGELDQYERERAKERE